MKTLLVGVSMLTLFAFNGTSQVNPHAIGLRGGTGYHGHAGEISYQHGFGSSNRLELDLGWRNYHKNNDDYSNSYLAGIYHWVWNITDGFNWYAGVGGIVGLHNHRHHDEYDGVTLDLAGQIGIEYDFNMHGAPILIGLDARPTWRFIGYGNNHYGWGTAFSIRYTF